MTNEQTNSSSDDSFLAEAEAEMMQLLNEEQGDAIALWLELYGDAFGRASSNCGLTVRTNFRYAANRLEVVRKNAKNPS